MSVTASDIMAVTKSVTKEWTKQRKAEERGRRSRSSRAYVYSDRVNFTEVTGRILPGAYEHASGGGKYTVSKRPLYYACRKSFAEWTGRELEYKYFANTLLVQHLNRNPVDWKITADPRGTLILPNAAHEVRIPCGTIDIDNHLATAAQIPGINAKLNTQYPSLAAGERYRGVMYIEKEGFGPLLKEARIAERFDIAILSCKGQSVVAARKFVDHVCHVGGGVPLFVGHDLDKAGFEISQRLTRVSDWARDTDRVTYDFINEIDAHDLGLRLSDCEKYELESERCEFKGRFARDSICTPEEREFLRSGKRIELNAFTSPDFVEWLESKLTEHLPDRLIPADTVLEDAYRRALITARINATVQEAEQVARDEYENATIPKALRRQLSKEMKASEKPWDQALYDLAESKVNCDLKD